MREEHINGITRDVIGAAIAVHIELGPGLLESAYEACLVHELAARRIALERQINVPVVYRGIAIDCAYRVDMIVESCVVVELKSVAGLDPIHTAQMLTYLKLTGCPAGLLINFNVPKLTAGIRRIILKGALQHCKGARVVTPRSAHSAPLR